jgi:beta-glucosidase-like glycosyl hydrolase
VSSGKPCCPRTHCYSPFAAHSPVLNSEYGAAFISGLQGHDARFVRIAATPKHFLGYDAPEDNPSRLSFDAIIGPQDLHDSYLPAFQAAIQRGHARGLMCSYNALNSVPMCANAALMDGLARKTWNFSGYIVTDCNAFDAIFTEHHYSANLSATIPLAYGAGADLYNCGRLRSEQLVDFMSESAAHEALLTENLRRLLTVQYDLGLFEPDPSTNPYSKLGPKDIDTAEGRALAAQAAAQSLVLVRNHPLKIPGDGRTAVLPLRGGGRRRHIALIGPNANATTTMQGNYFTHRPPYLVSPLEAFQRSELVPRVTHVAGCSIGGPAVPQHMAEAEAAARAADSVVLVVGLDGSQEGEGHDRRSLLLPGAQEELIHRVAAVSVAPVTLVVMSGSAVDVSASVHNPKVGAILWVGYPGQSGGLAIVDALLGVSSPAGRLPMTWYYANYTNQVQKTQMGLRPKPALVRGGAAYPGRTYRFMNSPVLFEFGSGLSYTTFAIDVSAPATLSLAAAENALNASRTRPDTAPPLASIAIQLSNTGTMASDTVLLLFLVPPSAGTQGRPIKSLRNFARVAHVSPQQHMSVSLNLSAHDFALTTASGDLVVVGGGWEVEVEGRRAVIQLI